MKYRTPTKAVITDAGCASRFLPITKTIPKAMLPIGAKPIMQLMVEECLAAGIRELILVVTPESRPIYEQYFRDPATRVRELMQAQGKPERFRPVQEVLDFPEITIIEQDPALPYGNGSPIASARPLIGDDEAFVVIYSDDVVYGSSDVQTLVEAYRAHPDAEAIIVGQEMPAEALSKYGIIKLKPGNEALLSHIVEKPAPGQAPSNLASYGRYLLTPAVFQYLNPEHTGLDGELWTVDAITKLAEQGKVYVEKTRGAWMTTGDPKNYFFALLHHALAQPDYLPEIESALAARGWSAPV